MDQVTAGDTELIKFMQKSFGYSLTADTKYECFFILYGPTSRNGKGTTMETINTLLGDYGKTAMPETLAKKSSPNGSGPSEDIARLACKFFRAFRDNGVISLISENAYGQ